MATRRRRKDRAHDAQAFAIRFYRGHWQIKHQQTWRNAREISLLAPSILTPTGEICGIGVVSQHGTVFSVNA